MENEVINKEDMTPEQRKDYKSIKGFKEKV
jgi:hypothetical protein